MATNSKTRKQRRLEKRQAIILLAVVLVVSLASFTLGVVVGRRGAERDLANKLSQTEKVLVAETPSEVTAPIPKHEPAKPVEKEAEGEVVEEAKLSFYDNLAKEEAPLGSGINLAPVEEKKAEVSAKPPIDLPEQPIVAKTEAAKPAAEAVVKKAAAVAKPQPIVAPQEQVATETMPASVAGGSHAVQIGSFNSAGDAVALKKKMTDKGYPAFVVEADLGKKGLWYRVRIGPYAGSDSAKKMQGYLEGQEKIKGFVSRQ